MSNNADRRNPTRLADKRRTLERRQARQAKQAVVATPTTNEFHLLNGFAA